ncbi:MAG: YdcF family protein [Clostridiaceae bacterium]|nr:YdcF family protein [Clostridiaceae bacterium]
MKLLKGKFLGKASIIMGIFSLIYFIAAKCYAITFANFFALLGVLLIAFGFFERHEGKDAFIKKFPKLMLFARGIFLSLLVSFIIIETLIIYNGAIKSTLKPDYIVILGAMVRGETPSLILSERLETSLNYIKKYPDIKVILSGGKGPGEDISEAEAMKRYLVSNGIEEKRLIKEDKSKSTMENLKFTSQIISKLENKKNINLLIVTSDFHMFRAKFLAQRNGFKPLGIPSYTILSIKPTYYIREYFGVIKSFFLDKD